MRVFKLDIDPAVQSPGRAVPGSGQSRTWFITENGFDIELVSQTKDEPAHFEIRKDDEVIHIPYTRSKYHQPISLVSTEKLEKLLAAPDGQPQPQTPAVVKELVKSILAQRASKEPAK